MISRRHFVRSLGASAGLFAVGRTVSAAEPPSPDLTSLTFGDKIDWDKVRGWFPLAEGLAYFNCGSLGPSASPVLREMWNAWETLEGNPVEEGYGPLLDKAEQVRAKAAAFLGCEKDEMAITQNTTEAMNAIAQGIDWKEGDRVLTTDHEHAGGLVGWQFFAKRRGVTIDTITLPLQPRDANEIVSLFEAKLTKQTRVISVSHVTYTTGLQLPITGIASLARAKGVLLVVDGAQAPGGLVVDLKKLGCHAYATSAHKWLLAPMGTGLLYVSDDAKGRIDPPLLAGGRRVYTAHTGTRNLPSIIGLGAAIDFLNKAGRESVAKRCGELRQMLCEKLSRHTKLRMVSPESGPFASPIVTVELATGSNSAAGADVLKKKHRIIVRAMSHGAIRGLRLSPHIYNSEEELDRLVAALKL